MAEKNIGNDLARFLMGTIFLVIVYRTSVCLSACLSTSCCCIDVCSCSLLASYAYRGSYNLSLSFYQGCKKGPTPTQAVALPPSHSSIPRCKHAQPHPPTHTHTHSAITYPTLHEITSSPRHSNPPTSQNTCIHAAKDTHCQVTSWQNPIVSAYIDRKLFARERRKKNVSFN